MQIGYGFINKVKQSSFAYKLVGLLSGTIVAQVIPILLSPVFSRLYLPQQFGEFAIFLSAASILSVVSNGRYAMAVMVEDDFNDRKYLFWGSILVCTVFCFICFIIGRYILPVYIHNSFIESPVNIIAVLSGTFLLSINQLLGFWFNKTNQLKIVAKSKVAQGVGIGLASLILGIWKFHFINGLVWGYIFGMLVANLYFWTAVIKYFNNSEPFKFRQLFRVLKTHIEYPLYSAPGALMDTSALQLPTIFLSYLFDTSVIGYWGFTIRLIQVPSSFISFSLSQVLFQRFTTIKDKVKLRTDVNKLMKALGLLFAPVGIVILLFGPRLFSFAFGKNWHEAGIYAQILIISFGLKFIITPVSIIFPAVNRVKLGTQWQLIYFIGTVFWLLAGYIFKFDIYLLLIIYSIHEAFLYGYYYYLIKKVLR